MLFSKVIYYTFLECDCMTKHKKKKKKKIKKNKKKS